MLHSVDFLILSVIKMYAQRAINNDKIIDDLFAWCWNPIYLNVFENDPSVYIDNIKNMVKENDVHFSLVYPSFQEKNNYCVVLSSGHETDLFLDDYGTTEMTVEDPKKVRNINVISAKNNWIETKTCVPRGYYVKNNTCQWSGKVIDIVDYGDSETKNGVYRLIFDTNLPVINNSFVLFGYYVAEQPKYSTTIYNNSSDTVSATLVLGTSGNYESHYIFNQFMRYVIKASRKQLDANGFQISTVSYGEISPLSSSSTNALKFQSQFHVTGRAIDQWIFDENAQPNNIIINSYPTRDFTDDTTVVGLPETEKRSDREIEAIIEVSE